MSDEPLRGYRERTSGKIGSYLALAAPSILLLIWGGLVAIEADDRWVTTVMLVSVAAALCNEERVRFKRRRNGRNNR